MKYIKIGVTLFSTIFHFVKTLRAKFIFWICLLFILIGVFIFVPHLGISLESRKAEIAEFTKINYYVGIVILIGLGVGILIFALLREKIQEINRLNIIKERDRIALDLHDGCAQELANIIKRLELCEKLFRIDPMRALEELDSLKENAKDILDKTRQVIFDLKVPEDANFNLLDSLDNYIKSYQKQNNINVKLDIFGSIGTIPSAKSKQIFYIIGEALTNIKKHSIAKNVELHVECNNDNALIIDIKDDGRGFDINEKESLAPNCGRWGLINMRQRASSLGGKLVIESMPNHGAEVHLNIPLKEKVV